MHSGFDGNIITAYRKEKSVGDHLIRSRLPSDTIPGTFRCSRNCITCDHVHQNERVVGPNATIRIQDSFSCISTGVVYCITCIKCGDLYIGQTKRRLADRFVEHLGDIRNARLNKSVARHFNQPDHSIHDVSVCCIRSEPVKRRRIYKEIRLIGHLGTVEPQGMNVEDDLIE